MIDELTDRELVERMKAGDEQAFSALYRRCQGPVYRYAWHMTGSASAAEDVTQEVFLGLVRGAGRYDAAKGTLTAFLIGMARIHVLRGFRNFGRGLPLSAEQDCAAGPDLEEQLGQAERAEQVRRAVGSLPERYREVVALCDLEEMDYAEAAAALGCAVGTVRSRLHRARRILSVKLSAHRQAGCVA